jgi:hypothetical protein
MQRLRLADLRASRLPTVLGECRQMTNLTDWVNTAQSRLIHAREAGDEGWWGTWAEMIFSVNKTNPYLTLPRSVARLQMVTVCDEPTPLQNQFYEYLQFGNGRMPRQWLEERRPLLQVHSRNSVVTWVDQSVTPAYVRAYCSNLDVSLRLLVQGTDSENNPVFTQDAYQRVSGVYVTLNQPFATTPLPFNSITGIQKDITSDPVTIYQVNTETGEETLLLTMEPTETTALYRRYYFHNLPADCCYTPGAEETDIEVRALVKLELIPLRYDADYCLLTGEAGKEAIILECQAVRMSEVDNTPAQAMAASYHKQAIGLLNGQLTHYLGTAQPALTYNIMGCAPLHAHKIGTLI